MLERGLEMVRVRNFSGMRKEELGSDRIREKEEVQR